MTYQGRGRGHHLILGLCVLDGQFHCNHESFQVTVALQCHHHLFWRQAWGTDLGAKADVALPPVHLKCMALVLGRPCAAWWRWQASDEPGFWKTGEVAPLPPLDPGLFSEARLALSSGRAAEHLHPASGLSFPQSWLQDTRTWSACSSECVEGLFLAVVVRGYGLVYVFH